LTTSDRRELVWCSEAGEVSLKLPNPDYGRNIITVQVIGYSNGDELSDGTYASYGLTLDQAEEMTLAILREVTRLHGELSVAAQEEIRQHLDLPGRETSE